MTSPRDSETLNGRSGLSFAQRFTRCVDRLRMSNGFQNRLANLTYKTALDRLLEAAQAEDLAMASAGLPHTLDVVNLMATIHNQ